MESEDEKDDSEPPSKSYIKSRFKFHFQFKNMSRTRQDMSEKESETSPAHFTLRIPHVSKKIFEYLDDKSLMKCREVNKSWQKFIDGQRFTWIRIIKAVGEYEKYNNGNWN